MHAARARVSDMSETARSTAKNGQGGSKVKTMTPSARVEKAAQAQVQEAVSAIRKKFGQGSIMRLGSDETEATTSISTGCLSLDLALGVGGLPEGRIVEIYGPEASGKTTLSLQALAQAQRAGKTAAFIDAEHSLDTGYARRLGVDVDDLLVSQPDCGEQALQIVEMLVSSGAVQMIVVDSVAALTPRAEIEGAMGDSHIGLQARMMSQALRKLVALVARHRVTLVFINQIRMKIGVMFGSPETTTGGNALKFFACVRLDVRKIATVKRQEVAVGTRVRVKVIKNKLAAPFREAEFDLMFGEGVARDADVFDLALAAGKIDKSGAWFSYKDQRLGQGRDNAIEALKKIPGVMDELVAGLRGEVAPTPEKAQATGG
jgi:recombination protein RecA